MKGGTIVLDGGDGNDRLDLVGNLSYSTMNFSQATGFERMTITGVYSPGYFTIVLGDATVAKDLRFEVDARAANNYSGFGVSVDASAEQDGSVWLRGSTSGDYFIGSHLDDKLEGDAGDDQLSGGDGSDLLDGGDGNDSLTGGAGNDTLSGGAGNDTLAGGTGDNVIEGGLGTDTVVFDGTSSDYEWHTETDAVGRSCVLVTDTITNETNTLYSVNYLHFSNETIQIVTPGIVLTGTDDADSLNAGSYDDVIYGYAGDDVIYSAQGDDYVDAGRRVARTAYRGVLRDCHLSYIGG